MSSTSSTSPTSSSSPTQESPEEIADKLQHCLRAFTDPVNNAPDIDANKMMEVAFDCLKQIKALDQKKRISCVWRMTQLGAFPLVVAAMVPGRITFSLSCTLLGVVLADDDLLSHKIGKTLVNDQRFLSAIEAGMTPSKNDNGQSAHTAMLVAQMLKNVLKTGSADMVHRVCSSGRIVEMFASVLQQASLQLDKMDWRFVFTITDMLMLMEIVPSNANQLDKNKVGQSAMQLLSTITPSSANVSISSILFDKTHLLHRLNCILMLWLGRVPVVEDSVGAKAHEIAKVIVQHPKTAESAESIATLGGHSLRAVATAIGGLGAGSFSEYEQCKNALGMLIRDWTAIEKSAEGVVRSTEFQRKVEEEKITTVQTEGNPKMKAVLKTKENGNILYKNKNFKEALNIYKKALSELKEQQELDCGPEDAVALELEEAKICNNLANVCLKLEMYDEAEDYATDAIDADPTAVKGFYRRAKAHEGNGNKEAAISDLKELLEVDPENSAAQTLLKSLQK